MRRSFLLAVMTVLVLLVGSGIASADYLGSDAFDELTGLTKSGGGLMDRFPLSAYHLDYHIDTKGMLGAPDVTSIPSQVYQIAAQTMWGWTSLVMWTVIEILAWVMSADFLTGPNGALRPIGDATQVLFNSLFGTSMMQNLAAVAGVWGLFMLINKRYGHMVNGLLMTVLFAGVALMVVMKPVDTATSMLSYTNPLKLAVLAGNQDGDADNAVIHMRDRLGETYILKPWARIEFGKLKVCVDTDNKNEDGYPDPVGETTKDARGRRLADICRDVLKQGADGHGGYAGRFLKAKGEKARKAEYDALRTGESPKTPQFAGYLLDKADSPAADYMQEGGSFQRMLLTGAVCFSVWGAIMLFGWLAIVMFLVTIAFLALIFAGAIAVFAAMLPGHGHKIFKWWIGKFTLVWLAPVAIAIVVTMITAVSLAFVSATAMAGLWAMLLNAGFCWGAFFGRKHIMRSLTNAVVSKAPDRITEKSTELAKTTAAVVALPAAAAAGALWNHVRNDHTEETNVDEDVEQNVTQNQPITIANGQVPAQAVAPAQAPAIEPGQRPRVEYQKMGELREVLVSPDRTPMDELLGRQSPPAQVYLPGGNGNGHANGYESANEGERSLRLVEDPITPIDTHVVHELAPAHPAQNSHEVTNGQLPPDDLDPWRFER